MPGPAAGYDYWFEDAGEYQDTIGGTPCTDGTQCVAYADQSSNHNDVTTGGTGPVYHTNILNSKAGLLYDGTASTLSQAAATLTITNAFTFFAVIKTGTLGALRTIDLTGSPTNGILWRVNTSSIAEIVKAGTGVIASGSTALSNSTAYLLSVLYDPTDTGGSMTFKINGVLDVKVTGLGTVTWGTMNKLQLGSNSGVQFWNGYEFEILGYGSALSGTNFSTTESYLLSKYGFSTPSASGSGGVQASASVLATSTRAGAGAVQGVATELANTSATGAGTIHASVVAVAQNNQAGAGAIAASASTIDHTIESRAGGVAALATVVATLAPVDQVALWANTLIATPPSPPDSGTTLVVAAGTGILFPSPPFNAIVVQNGQTPNFSNAEVIRVQTVAGDTFSNIIRGMEGTIPRSIKKNDTIDNGLTPWLINQIVFYINFLLGGIGLPTALAYSGGISKGQLVYITDQAGTTVAVPASAGVQLGVPNNVCGFAKNDAAGGIQVTIAGYGPPISVPDALWDPAPNGGSGVPLQSQSGKLVYQSQITDGNVSIYPNFLSGYSLKAVGTVWTGGSGKVTVAPRIWQGSGGMY